MTSKAEGAKRTRYGDLLSRNLALWAMMSTISKFPVAMAPIAMVFLAREAPDGYSRGAILASVYVAGEVAGALLLGRGRAGTSRFGVSVGFIVGSGAFGLLALSGAESMPYGVLLAFLAGAAPAAAPGALRAHLTGLVSEELVPKALSVETTLTQAIWAAAPALVVLLALKVGASAPVWVAAGLAAIGCLLIACTRSFGSWPAAAESATEKPSASLLTGWPVYLMSASAMIMLASVEIVLPALLEFRGIGVGWSGPLLVSFAVASSLGAIGYGWIRWRGRPDVQSHIFLVVTAAALLGVAIINNLVISAVLLAVGGLFQSGVLVTRNLALREQLPASLHAGGYSMMYAVQGVGYGIAATASAVVLQIGTPQDAAVVGVVLALALAAVSAFGGRSGRVHPVGGMGAR